MTIWTLYDHPVDEPGWIVLRRWQVVGDGVVPEEAHLFDTVDDARAWLMARIRGLVLVQRAPDDDPVIIESWV